MQKIKQKTFQHIQTVSTTEKLECLQHMTRNDCVDEGMQDAEVNLTSTLSRGGLITLNKNSEHFFQLLEVKVREVCSNTDQEQCTFKQFEMMCSSDEVMTSQFAETMYTVDTCTSDIQKEDLFAEVVTLYCKIRVHHACRTYMDKSRNQMNVS